MSQLFHWRTELRDDGVWEPPAPRLMALLPSLLIAVSFIAKYPGDGWMAGAALAALVVGLWTAGAFRWGWRDRLVLGIESMRSGPGEPILVTGRRRTAMADIDRLVVQGPLARRVLMLHTRAGGAYTVLGGTPNKDIELAERYLLAHQDELPFKVEIRAPESPFLQSDTVF